MAAMKYAFVAFILINLCYISCFNTPQPFKLSVSSADLSDLQQRVSLARIPEEYEDISKNSWALGMNLHYLRDIVSYWKNSYNYTQRLELINKELPQYLYKLSNGATIHYVAHRSNNRNSAIPLLFLHGWPSSILECRRILPLLAELGPNYDIICPNLPGYGHSSAFNTSGYDIKDAADYLVKFMKELGYKHYAVIGGDCKLNSSIIAVNNITIYSCRTTQLN
jgi:hypothetical protein